eukprot:3374482-Pyramimonas_sp.AAC.1
MSRSKCARRGKTGRWARGCAGEPDERGRKRQAGFDGFQADYLGADGALRDACQREHATQSGVRSLTFPIFATADTGEQTFTGLQVQMVFGLADAGA